jgi:hypothetical protein
MLDFRLIFFYIFPRLFLNTLVSGIICIIVGSAIGLIVGLSRQRIHDTLFVSYGGTFFGCLLVFITITHLIATRSYSLNTWGEGGLESIALFIGLFLVLIGGFAGGAIASIFCFREFLALRKELVITILACIYVLQSISLYYNYFSSCPSSSFCKF